VLEVRGHVFVCYVMYLCVKISILPLSTILIFDFEIFSKMWKSFFFHFILNFIQYDHM